MDADDYGAFGLAWKTAPTLRGSLQRAERYAQLLTSVAAYEVCDTERGAFFRTHAALIIDDAIKAKAIGEGLAENAKELANVGAGLLNGPSVAHVRLDDVVHEVPDSVRDLIVKARGRKTWDVTIADYGTGILGLYAA